MCPTSHSPAARQGQDLSPLPRCLAGTRGSSYVPMGSKHKVGGRGGGHPSPPQSKSFPLRGSSRGTHCMILSQAGSEG